MTHNKNLRLINDADFRELFHRVIYIKPTKEVIEHLAEDMDIYLKDRGFLAYGYIDNQCGFSFRIICSAHIRNNKLEYGAYDSQRLYIIRRGYVNCCSFAFIEEYDVEISDLEESALKHIRDIDMLYKCREETEQMRKFMFLDPFRSKEYPDDLQVILFKEGLQLEAVWVKCYTYTDNELFGLLLNEPEQDFGFHEGSIIGFAPMETDNGTICVYTGRRLEKLS